MKMIAVNDNSGRFIKINCLEDPGSQVALITSKIANSLDLKQEKSNVILSDIGSSNLRTRTSASLAISTASGSSLLRNVHVFKKISQHQPCVNVIDFKEKYKHLRNVDVQLLDGPIDLLIGQGCPDLLRQLETKYGKKDEPYSVRTKLGWSICGPLGKATNVRSLQLIIHC